MEQTSPSPDTGLLSALEADPAGVDSSAGGPTRDPAVVSPHHPAGARYLALWTRLAVVFVVVLGMFALLQVPEATRSYDVTFAAAGWTAVALFMVSLTNVTVCRFLMLPAMARRPDGSPDRIISIGYLFALTPALYGVTSVILSGEGWISLPFTLLSAFAIVDLRVYFAGAYEQAEA